jgi:putative PEP-CTERM system TPR-repeat lipoprotein
MSTIFRKLHIILAVSCLLLACGEDLSSEEYLARGNQYIEEGDFSAAIIELKNSIRKDDSNVRARTTLGELYFDRAYFPEADKELSKALAAGMDPTVVVPTLAQVLLGLGEWDRLEQLPSDGLDAESLSTLQAAKGMAKLYQKDLAAASELIDAAAQSEPSSHYAQVSAARLSMMKGDSAGARQRLKGVFVAAPKFPPAWNLLGDIERDEKNYKAAEKAYSKAISLTKNSFDSSLSRAMVRIDMKNFEGARKELARIESSYTFAKSHRGVHFARGIVFLKNEKTDLAIQSLERAAKSPESYPLSLYYLAAIYAEQGRNAKALRTVNRFLTLMPEDPAGLKLAAQLELDQKNFSNAEELLIPVLASDENDIAALNLMSNALLAQEKAEAGIELLERVVKLDPKSIQAKVRLGTGYLAAGQGELGLETLRGVLATNPEHSQADTLIVMYFLRQKQVEEAIQAAQEYTGRNPSAASYVMLARTYLANNQQEEAKGAFNKALELNPGDPSAGNSLAGYALADKDYDSARQYYQQVLEHNPDNMDTRMRVAATYAMEGKDQEMLDNLDATLAAYPRSMEPRLAKARYFIAKGEPEKAIPLIEALSEKQKEHQDTLETQVTLELTMGRFHEAVGTSGQLIDLYPNVAKYHFMKSKAYAGVGDKDKLSAELDRTLELDPNHLGAKVAAARLALLSNDTSVFEAKLAELKRVAPGSTDVVQLEVAFAYKQGDKKRAEELLESLFKRNPTSSTAIALASVRQMDGDSTGAVEQLKRWLEDNPNDVKVREKLAEIYLATNQIKEVMAQCREILELQPNNIVALNNLAWYLLKDDPKQALAYAERAIALSPGSASVLDTLAVAQLKNNNVDDARRNIDRALSIDPKNADMRFHEAMIRTAEGDASGAVFALNSLLGKGSQFSERAEAEAFLKKLKANEG